MTATFLAQDDAKCWDLRLFSLRRLASRPPRAAHRGLRMREHPTFVPSSVLILVNR